MFEEAADVGRHQSAADALVDRRGGHQLQRQVGVLPLKRFGGRKVECEQRHLNIEQKVEPLGGCDAAVVNAEQLTDDSFEGFCVRLRDELGVFFGHLQLKQNTTNRVCVRQPLRRADDAAGEGEAVHWSARLLFYETKKGRLLEVLAREPPPLVGALARVADPRPVGAVRRGADGAALA